MEPLSYEIAWQRDKFFFIKLVKYTVFTCKWNNQTIP